MKTLSSMASNWNPKQEIVTTITSNEVSCTGKKVIVTVNDAKVSKFLCLKPKKK